MWLGGLIHGRIVQLLRISKTGIIILFLIREGFNGQDEGKERGEDGGKDRGNYVRKGGGKNRDKYRGSFKSNYSVKLVQGNSF